MNNLANVIFMLHLLIILFILFTPFTNILPILICHVCFCFLIIFHWLLNNNVCALSLLECKLRGIPMDNTFVSRIVTPFYSPNNENVIVLVSEYILILLIVTSLYKILTHPKIKYCYANFSNLSLLQCIRFLLDSERG